MLFNVGLPCITGYLLFLVMLHFVLSSQNTLWLSETENIFLDKYRQELRSTTEVAAGIVETIFADNTMSYEEKMSLARKIIRPLRFGTDGYFYAYEKGNGLNVIHGSKNSLEGTSLWGMQDPEKTQFIIRELDRVAGEGTMFHEFYWTKLNSDDLFPKLGTAMAIPGTNLWIGTGAYTDDMNKELAIIKSRINGKIRNFEIIIFSALFIIAVISIFFLIKFSKNLAQPVIDLRNLLIKSGGKDFTERGVYKEKSKCLEINDLYNAINSLFDDFTRVVIQTKENTASARNMSRQLAEISASSNKNVNAMNSKLTGLSKEADKLHGNIGESFETTKEFQNFIGNVDLLITEQVAALEESTAAVEQMINSINSLAEGTEKRNNLALELSKTSKKGKEDMNASISNMKIISKSTEEIGNMINLIDDLSEKTNLLSMNAAIEASHAGASGGGFAVISKEIRALSVDSSKNAKTISDSLKAITAQIKENEVRTSVSGEYFGVMADNITEISDGLQITQNAIQEVAAGGHQLIEAIHSLREMSSRVSNSSSMIKEKIDEISGTFGDIKEIAKMTNTELAGVVTDLENVAGNMEELTQSGTENENSLNNLEESLSMFKVSK